LKLKEAGSTFIQSITCPDYPTGFERRPSREESPETAKFYFVDLRDDDIPDAIRIELSYSGETKMEGWHLGMYVYHEKKTITVNAARWITPTRTSRERIPLKSVRTVEEAKFDLFKVLNVTAERQAKATFWIGPKATAVPLTGYKAWFFIKDDDLILVKLPTDDNEPAE
jgi:hypothetical protein